MNELTIVFENNNEAVTSSRLVAEYFGKRHDSVIRAIKNLNCSKDFNAHNFAVVNYTDKKGEKRQEYLMTKDGFTILAMGFTGAKAMQFKEAYINAFNKMESLLKGNTTILELERRIEALEQANEPFRSMTEDSIIKDFENAINEAIESGEYHIKRKGYVEITTSTLLGVYDMFTYSLIGQRAYDIYKAYATRIHHKPVHRQALYNLLLTRGHLIQPSTEERKRRRSISIKEITIDKMRYRCLVIKKQSLNFKHN